MSIGCLLAAGLLEATLTWFPGLLPHQVRAINNRMETAVRWDDGVTGDPFLGYKPKPGVATTVKMDGVTAELRTVRLAGDDIGFRDMGAPFNGPPADLAIGDSFTVCYGVAASDCWVSRLGRSTGRQIVDLGVSGYSAVGASRLLQRYGAGFRPQLVLHGIFLNDFEENEDFVAWEHSGSGNLRAWYHEQNLGELGYQLYKRFRTYRLLRSVLRASRSQTYHLQENGLNLYLSPSGWWVHATEHAAAPEYFEFMQKVLLDEQQTARAMGAQLIVLLFPFKEQVYWDRLLAQEPKLKQLDVDRPYRLLADFCSVHGIPSVDLTEPLRAHARAGEQLYFSIDAHWNPHGNDVAAGIVFDALKGQGVL